MIGCTCAVDLFDISNGFAFHELWQLNNVLVVYFISTYATIGWLYLGLNSKTTVAAFATSLLVANEILTGRSMIVLPQ